MVDDDRFFATGIDSWDRATVEFGSRVIPPMDDTMRVRVSHYENGISVLLTRKTVQDLHEYLDMENAGNFVASDGNAFLVVYQESDGCTFFRTYRNGSTRHHVYASYLAYLSNEDTGRLYEWLEAALTGKWEGWVTA